MSRQVNKSPNVVGEAIIVTVLTKENYIRVSSLHSGCCRIPYEYLMDTSYKEKCVHFIDCINLSKVKENCTGTMCIFRTKSKEKNRFCDWNLGVVLYFSKLGLILYKFDDLSCFSEMDCDLVIENYLSSKIIFTMRQLLDNEVEVEYINQLSGNKLFNKKPPSEQFKLVWDKASLFVQCSPEGPDTLPFSNFIYQNKRIYQDWKESRIPSSTKSNQLLATRKRKRKPSHPFEYHLTSERETLERHHWGCYYDESTCKDIPKNNFYAVPFTDSTQSMDEEVVLSYLSSEAMKSLLRFSHKTEQEHNKYLYENGCWFETVKVHHPNKAPGGITYSKVNKDQHGTWFSTNGEYYKQVGVVVSHWMEHTSLWSDNIDYDMFVKIKDNVYKNYSFERNIFSKVGCNIYSGKLRYQEVNCHFNLFIFILTSQY